LGEGLFGLGERPRKKGGQRTGPNPTDKGKAGSKHHLVSDRGGIPLAVVLTAANVHDSKVLEEAVDAIEPIKRPRGRPGRPRKRPEKLHADKAYDFGRCRKALHKRGIKARIARRGIDSSERLGRYRWVVERTLAWLGRYRRLTVRYERRDDIHEAFLHLGCSLICLNYLK
jgi:transposase